MKSKAIEKGLKKYIKENLSRGYSIKAIEKALIVNGYSQSLVINLINGYKLKKIILKSIPLFAALIVLISAVFFIRPAITGLTIASKSFNYTDKIDLDFNESGEYIWNMENKGYLKSVRLNGKARESGFVRAYLEFGNKTYLIFDNRRMGSSLGDITGFAVKEDKISVEIKGSLNAEASGIIDSLVYDINNTKNKIDLEIEIKTGDNKTRLEIGGSATDSQQLMINSLISALKNTGEDFKIKIKADFPEAETEDDNSDIENETEINETINITSPVNDTNISLPMNDTSNYTTNITPAINDTINITPELNGTNATEPAANKSITVGLQYNDGTIYDEDNDGVESTDGIIDFTVKNTGFSWDANKDNLCTRWDVYSEEEAKSTMFCYGSDKCCNFLELSPARKEWDAPLYLSYGQYGAALNNVVSAQVLYIDYNLTGDGPFSEIYYSGWQNLSASFYEGFASFEGACIETCILPNLDSQDYKIIFEVNGSELALDSIDYEVSINETENRAPILLKNFSDIALSRSQSLDMNLSEYFYDPDNDTLIFSAYNNSGISVLISNGTAILTAPGNFTEADFMFFIAYDSEYSATSNVFRVDAKKQFPAGLKSLREIAGKFSAGLLG